MGTKVTSSSGSVLKEPEIQKLQMQAKIFKENSLNKLNALKSTTQLLERQTFSGCLLYQQAFAQLFGDSVRTFKFQLSQHMNNLETLLNAETLHEMDSKSALSVIKVQFERFINSDLLKPLDIYSRSFSSDREVRENFRDYTKMTAQTFKETIIQNMNSIEQCIIERASHEQELKMTLKKLSERQLQIQQCKVQEVQSSVTSSGDETSSGIVSDEEIDKQELEAHYGFMAKIQEVLPAESSSTDTPLEQVQNNDEKNVFANERQHSEKHAAECADERAALANLIANLTLDTEENKTILKQLKKANASLTQELEKCKTNLDETNSALGEAISCRDSCLIALQNKQNEFEKYKAFNDRTIDYEILQTKLNETLGLLALTITTFPFSSHQSPPCHYIPEQDVQAIYAKELPISSPDPITSPAFLTLSLILPPSLLFDLRYFFVLEELLAPKKRIHFPSSSSTTFIESSQNQNPMYLKHHEKQVEDILNYLDELHLHRIERMEEGRINGNKLKTELKRIRTQIIKLQKKKLGQKDKIAFAHYRISNLEQIIKEIQARHQTDQEDL
ncbi:hypothetical protein Tco_1263115 [Tanacetum coccineum]